jgi:hypothetical protein
MIFTLKTSGNSLTMLSSTMSNQMDSASPAAMEDLRAKGARRACIFRRRVVP